jgi:hypothetical protein
VVVFSSADYLPFICVIALTSGDMLTMTEYVVTDTAYAVIACATSTHIIYSGDIHHPIIRAA